MIEKLMKDANVLKYCRLPCIYPKDTMIFIENTPCTSIGIIVKGAIKLNHFSIDGDETIYAHLRKGDLFGDFLVFSSRPWYPGNIVTLEETAIAYITSKDIDALMVESTSFRQYFLNNLSQKALDLNHRNKLLTQPTLKHKIIYWLEHECARTNTAQIAFGSKTALAQTLHVQRPSLSRTLGMLKKEGLVDYDSKHIWFKTNQS